MRIAVASSGLGHVTRGIETWALDTAVALAERGVDVTLFAGGETPVKSERVKTVVVSCFQRNRPRARRLTALTPNWAWRWGGKTTYGWEQLSFWWRLWPTLRCGAYDILHVQDPLVAEWCRRFRRWGIVRTKEILAHGTEEAIDFLQHFDYVQHLAPWHLREALDALRAVQRSTFNVQRPLWTAIPNFVDTGVFRPREGAEGGAHAFREKHGIPRDAVVFGCAAAVKKHHKRVDYLIREFARYLNDDSRPGVAAAAYLVIAGSRQQDSEELIMLAEELAPGRIRIALDLSREEMPEFYGALDVFILTSLFEMMPIALLEALASGVPIIANRHPVLEWIVGDGGMCIDMSEEGGLARFLGEMEPQWRTTRGVAARERAEKMFAKEIVIAEIVDYYRKIMEA